MCHLFFQVTAKCYLFVIAVCSIAACMMGICSHSLLEGVQMPSYPVGIPLLQNADNATSFMEGSVEEAWMLSTLGSFFLQILQFCAN